MIKIIALAGILMVGQQGHVVYNPKGGYTCQPEGATCKVPTAKEVARHVRHGKVTELPSTVSTQTILAPKKMSDFVQGVQKGMDALPAEYRKGYWETIPMDLHDSYGDVIESSGQYSGESTEPILNKPERQGMHNATVFDGPNNKFTLLPSQPPYVFTIRGSNGVEFELRAKNLDNPDTATLGFDNGFYRVERMSNAEYAGLEKLRQAVRDEEVKIAKAHGVRAYPAFDCGSSDSVCTDPAYWIDHYEFRGQFLLVNLPDAVPEGGE